MKLLNKDLQSLTGAFPNQGPWLFEQTLDQEWKQSEPPISTLAKRKSQFFYSSGGSPIKSQKYFNSQGHCTNWSYSHPFSAGSASIFQQSHQPAKCRSTSTKKVDSQLESASSHSQGGRFSVASKTKIVQGWVLFPDHQIFHCPPAKMCPKNLV